MIRTIGLNASAVTDTSDTPIEAVYLISGKKIDVLLTPPPNPEIGDYREALRLTAKTVWPAWLLNRYAITFHIHDSEVDLLTTYHTLVDTTSATYTALFDYTKLMDRLSLHNIDNHTNIHNIRPLRESVSERCVNLMTTPEGEEHPLSSIIKLSKEVVVSNFVKSEVLYTHCVITNLSLDLLLANIEEEYDNA